MVKHHLVGFRNTIERMRPATIEKYFFHPERPSGDLLKLQYVDSAATVGQGKKADMSGYMKIERVVRNISKSRKEIGIRPLLSGHDIMKFLRIPPGPIIGTLLEALRDAQLRGKMKSKPQAYSYLKRIYRAL
jgi:poly(A) polymerase